MRRPLCAWVIEPDHRFCRKWSVYVTADGKRYCGQHAGRSGVADAVVGRVLPARRSLYTNNPNNTVKMTDIVDLIDIGGSGTMPFEVEAKVGGEYNAEDYAPAGIYEARVESVLPFESTKYMSSEPQTQARITWTVTSGPFEGKKAERLYSPSLNEASRLYPIFKALTGITPVPGQRYDIEALLVGKPAQIVVMDHTNQAGNTRRRVENVLPLQPQMAAQKPKRTKLVEVDEDDDDLDDENT